MGLGCQGQQRDEFSLGGSDMRSWAESLCPHQDGSEVCKLEPWFCEHRTNWFCDGSQLAGSLLPRGHWEMSPDGFHSLGRRRRRLRTENALLPGLDLDCIRSSWERNTSVGHRGAVGPKSGEAVPPTLTSTQNLRMGPDLLNRISPGAPGWLSR